MVKKILSKIGYTIFVLLLIAVAGLFLAPQLPTNISRGIEVKIVKSGSMEPAIKTGGIVVTIPRNTYFVGDIITFGKDTKTEIPTTHRVVSTRNEANVTYFATKGDANEEADPEETRQSSVIGKVLFTIPYAGYILDFSKQPLGFILLIALPAGLIILTELWSIYEELRRILRKRKYGDEESGVVESMSEEPAKKKTVFRMSQGIDSVVPSKPKITRAN